MMGVSVTVTTLSEIPLFFFSTNILNAMSPDWVLCISILSYVIRFSCYWMFSIFKPIAWFVLLPETMHGLTFALLWCGAVAKTQSFIKGGHIKSGIGLGLAQGILSFGQAVGAFCAGIYLKYSMNDPYSWTWMFATSLNGALLVTWFMITFIRRVCLKID